MTKLRMYMIRKYDEHVSGGYPSDIVLFGNNYTVEMIDETTYVHDKSNV